MDRPRYGLYCNAASALIIAFGGDAAGGGLCVTTCLATRAAGLLKPAAIIGLLDEAAEDLDRAALFLRQHLA